ncbi:tetratricopeptide (TPR) repeat protein [Pedobacter cryoconitis]|uniref:Tetratricopeptide (TPR) repeat protein n=1 Tax=Pedobacter cryoconitis TaxID=188932 RepID=A0A7W8ZJE3_9SPHI|nr:cellulose synthase subunit BcsC-related outer membrane protein [Pedobacter cryoconitis]MBB5634970.1 tetratricopeptide (TPR) repeat protein [Pedobacter cryoconitis]
MNNNKFYVIFLLFFLPWVGKTQTPLRTAPLTAEQREVFIQNALKLRKDENFTGALMQLDSILQGQPKDAAALLFKGDLLLQNKSFSKAVTTYQALLSLNYEPTITRINLSYALFMAHHPSKALHYAKIAWEGDKINPNAVVNYFNAMLWNIQTKQASDFLQKQNQLLKPDQILVLKARLYTTSGNYKKGILYYDSLNTKFLNKFYRKEYAEVLLGKKQFKASIELMKKDSTLFSPNEYHEFIQKYKGIRRQGVGTEFAYFEDIAKNVRIENAIWWQQGEGHVYTFGLRAGVSSITSFPNQKTNAEFIHLTISERWSKAWTGLSDLHLQRIQPEGTKGFYGLTGKQTIQYQPNDRKMVGLFYSSDILNYTASLLGQNIRSSSFGYVTHLMLNGRNGFYSQGTIGFLSDDNVSNQFFGSLYHLFRTEPTLKAGLNFSALHYKDNSIQYYFSPNRYLSSEVFADYTTPLPALSKFYLQVQAGAGFQKIEKLSWESAFRFQPEIGMRLNHFETAFKYQTSNVASSTGTGYRFNWYTLRLAWRW